MILRTCRLHLILNLIHFLADFFIASVGAFAEFAPRKHLVTFVASYLYPLAKVTNVLMKFMHRFKFKLARLATSIFFAICFEMLF